MKYLVDPRSVTLSWCPIDCPEFGPVPLYGVPACYDYCRILA